MTIPALSWLSDSARARGAQDDGEDAAADAAAGAPAVSASALNMQKMLADFGLPDLYSHLSTIGSLLRHLRRPFPDSPVTTWTLKFPEPLEVLYFNFFFAQDLRRFQRTMFMTIVACIGIILINVRTRAHAHARTYDSARDCAHTAGRTHESAAARAPHPPRTPRPCRRRARPPTLQSA